MYLDVKLYLLQYDYGLVLQQVEYIVKDIVENREKIKKSWPYYEYVYEI